MGCSPPRSGAEIPGPCGTVVGTFLCKGFLSFFFHRVKLVVFALSGDSAFCCWTSSLNVSSSSSWLGLSPISVFAVLLAATAMNEALSKRAVLTLKYPIQHVVLGVRGGNLAPPSLLLAQGCAQEHLVLLTDVPVSHQGLLRAHDADHVLEVQRARHIRGEADSLSQTWRGIVWDVSDSVSLTVSMLMAPSL